MQNMFLKHIKEGNSAPQTFPYVGQEPSERKCVSVLLIAWLVHHQLNVALALQCVVVALFVVRALGMSQSVLYMLIHHAYSDGGNHKRTVNESLGQSSRS